MKFELTRGRGPIGQLSTAVSLASLLLLLTTTLAFGQVIADPNTDPRVREIAKDLQCPVCQGLSVADSPSGLATDMRSVIAKKLDEGWSREQVEQYFVERYGEGILSTPPRHGFSALVWIGPWLALGFGLVVVAVTLRGRLRARADTTLQNSPGYGGRANEPDADPARIAAESDIYERQLEVELARERERA